jgi:uncharacterized protein (TIGR00251 family)
LIYSVRVEFNSGGEVTVEGDEITVPIRSAPLRGRANAELVKKLARHFGVDQSSVRIVRGLTSRRKMVEIS